MTEAQRRAGSRLTRLQRGLPTVVWATAWVSFFADVSTEMIYGVLPAFYLGTLSLSLVWLGLIEGSVETIVSITKLLSGFLSDRVGSRKGWMILGYALSAIAKPPLALVGSGIGAGVLRGADRFGKGIRGSPRDALVSAAVGPETRGRAFGVQRALDHAGALTGGVLAATLLIIGLASIRQLFLFSILPGAIAVLIIVRYVPGRSASNDRPRSPPLREVLRSHGSGLGRYLLPAGVLALGNSSDILLLALCYRRFLDAGSSQRSALAMLPLLWALLHVVKAVGSTWGGTLSDRIGRLGVLRLAWLVYAGVYLGAALMAAGGPALMAWGLFPLYGLYTVLAEGPERALIADLAPRESTRGTAYGLVHFVTGVLVLPATVLAALVWETAGAAWAFGLDALLALVAVGVLAWISPGLRRQVRIASGDGSHDAADHR